MWCLVWVGAVLIAPNQWMRKGPAGDWPYLGANISLHMHDHCAACVIEGLHGYKGQITLHVPSSLSIHMLSGESTVCSMNKACTHTLLWSILDSKNTQKQRKMCGVTSVHYKNQAIVVFAG